MNLNLRIHDRKLAGLAHVISPSIVTAAAILWMWPWLLFASAGDSLRVPIFGTRASIVPAKGYTVSADLGLVSNQACGTWLLFVERSDSFDSVVAGFNDPAYSSATNVVPLGKISRPSRDGLSWSKLTFEQVEGVLDTRTWYIEVLIQGDTLGSLIATMRYPDTSNDAVVNELHHMVETLRWDRSRHFDPMDLYGFTIEARGRFLPKSIRDAHAFFAPPGEGLPEDSLLSGYYVIATPSTGPWLTEKMEREAVERHLRWMAPLVGRLSVIDAQKLIIDGMAAYETVCHATLREDRLLVYLAVLSHPRTDIALLGIALGGAMDSDIVAFREMTRTITRRRASAGTPGECKRLLDAALYQQARECFEEALKTDSTSIPAALGRAEALRFQGLHRGAIEQYTSILDREPDAEEALLGRGVSYDATSEFKNAIADLNRAVQLNSGNVEAYKNRALAKMHYGNVPGAIDDFQRAIDRSPRPLHLYEALADAYMYIEHWSSAVSPLTDALAIDSTDTNLYVKRAKCHASMEEFVEARSDLNRALALQPYRRQVRKERGWVNLCLGHLKEAVRDFDLYLERFPHDAKAKDARGRARIFLGDTSQGLADIAASIRLDKTLSVGYFDRGFFRLMTRQYKEAADDFRVAASTANQRDWGKGSGYSDRDPVEPELKVLQFACEQLAYGSDVARARLTAYRKSANRWRSSLLSIDYVLGTLTEDELLFAIDTTNVPARYKSVDSCAAYFTIGLIQYISGLKQHARSSWQKCLEFRVLGSPVSQFVDAYLKGVWGI